MDNSQLAVSEVVVRLRRLLHAAEYAAGLNPVQWETLRYFSRCNRFSNGPAALVAFLGSTKGTVSQTLAALEKKGLLRKVRSTSDRRGFSIHLTPAGEAMLAADPARQLDAAAEASSGELRGALVRLLADLQANRGLRSFGLCRSCRHFGRNATGKGAHRCRLLDLPLSENDGNRICVEHEWAAVPA